MRKLNQKEMSNEQIIAQFIGQYALLHATRTGLEKCTFDATESIRALFLKAGFHNYDSQGRGREECGEEKPALFVSANRVQERVVSLYKPKAKAMQGGDPRFWPCGAKEFISPDEVIAVFIHKRKLCLINISREILRDSVSEPEAHRFIEKFLKECEETLLELAYELVQKLRDLARHGPLIAPPHDRGVGYAIEQALKLKTNSRGNPDYKGKIEIKSGRGRSNMTLFSSAPDWKLAEELNTRQQRYVNRYCISSRSILYRYGYWRNSKWNLSCDVSTRGFNTQGLKIHLDQKQGTLVENCRQKPEQVAIWRLRDLHTSLVTKHPETMFIKARSEKRSQTEEAFFLEKATYVRTPSFSKFDELLACGVIVVCHRQHSEHDHGIGFRIPPTKASQLFLAQPRNFQLAPE
jgi:hypothetical protein